MGVHILRVMANGVKLADANYVHEYFVDGAPVLGDVFDPVAAPTGRRSWSVAWALVAEQEALDVYDQLDPKALWEFSNPNLGFHVRQPEHPETQKRRL